MAFEKPASFDGLDLDALRALSDEALTEAREILGTDDADLTDEQIALAEQLMSDAAEIETHIEGIESAEQARADRIAAARAAVSGDEEEPEPVEEPVAEEEIEEPVEEPEPVLASGTVVPNRAIRRAVARAAAKAPKVQLLEPVKPPMGTIVAAANVPGVVSGAELADMDELVAAFTAKSRPLLNRKDKATMERHNVAVIKRPESEFAITAGMDFEAQMKVILAAANESRLEGKSLVAAGGWCAPSETLYDFCEIENPGGFLSLPEVTIRRGGINFTKGPQLADLLSDPDFGFLQTEAQAEAGTEKVCFEITCPDFEDHRLDVIGWCLKAGILTASPAGWPELIRRTLNLAVLGHRIKVNANLLTRLSTAIGAATDYVEIGSATSDILDALVLQRLVIVEQYALAETASVEVILPQWLREFIRSDLSRRTGVDLINVTDAYIDSLFRTRRLAPQFVYGYQPVTIPPTAGVGTAFPTTLEAMIYPAGSYVRGASDVISLDTVYDSVGLSTNTYTAAFFEEGIMLFNPCGGGRKVSISLTGKSDNVGATGFPQIGAGAGVTFASA